MALRIGKANGEILSNMVLAHRVAVRLSANTPSSDEEWLDVTQRETITRYALEIALGQHEQYMLDYIRNAHINDDSMDAYVALVRLEFLGLVEV